jgi:hypothetical protein
MRQLLGLLLILATTSFGSGYFGGGSSSSGTGDVVGPSSSTDNAVARFDLTTGKLLQDSNVQIGDVSGSKVIVQTIGANALELKGGDATSAGAGKSLILRGGNESGSNDQGDILFGGTANTTGNRATVGSETDGVGEFGYCYGLGAYCRFRAGYFKTSLEIRDSGGSSSGFNFFQDGTDSQIRMYRSTSSHGLRISNNGNGVLTFQNEAADTTFFQINQGNLILGTSSSNVARFNNATQTTVGAAGGASALPATPTGYLEFNINGTAYVLPYYAKS